MRISHDSNIQKQDRKVKTGWSKMEIKIWTHCENVQTGRMILVHL